MTTTNNSNVRLNKGEWSELYATLFLLSNPKINIANSDLEIICNDLFLVKEILLKNNSKFKIINDLVFVYVNDELRKELSLARINDLKKVLLKRIKDSKFKARSFDIIQVESFFRSITSEFIYKSPSTIKSDVEMKMLDNKMNKDIILKYSVKSSLGAPSTILNASKHTDFEFIINGLKKDSVKKVNNIKSRNKLKDRIAYLLNEGAQIKFNRVVSESFDYNLRLIDNNMPVYIANTLLMSYMTGDRDLKDAFIKANKFDDENMALKKLSDFLHGISFEFIPSKKSNGECLINGGLIVVKTDESVCLLDLIYYKKEVIKYILNQSKLDTPSSRRYKMLELYEDNGKIKFTLNLQIRYKR